MEAPQAQVLLGQALEVEAPQALQEQVLLGQALAHPVQLGQALPARRELGCLQVLGLSQV